MTEYPLPDEAPITIKFEGDPYIHALSRDELEIEEFLSQDDKSDQCDCEECLKEN